MKKKVLVMNFGGLGDQILFLPSFAALKNFFEKDEIFFITEGRAKCVGRITNLVDEKNIISFDYKHGNKAIKALELLKLMRAGNYDYVFSTGSSIFVRVLLFLSGIKNRFYIKRSALKKYKNEYAAKMLFELVREFTGENFANPVIDIELDFDIFKNQSLKGAGTLFSPPSPTHFASGSPEGTRLEKNSYSLDQLKQTNSSKLIIGIHPGVSKISIIKKHNKEWNVEGWVALAKKLLEKMPNATLVLLGGSEDQAITNEITKSLGENKNIIDLTMQTPDLKDFATVIKNLDILICHDSAPMHISYTLGTKTIALFSSTDHKRLVPPDIDHLIPLYGFKNSDGKYDWNIDEILGSLL